MQEYHLNPHAVDAQVGKTRLYTPQAEDVGSVLKMDVVSCDTVAGYAREVRLACCLASAEVSSQQRRPKRSGIAETRNAGALQVARQHGTAHASRHPVLYSEQHAPRLTQVGRTFSVRSERVRPAPQPPARSLVALPPPKGAPLAQGGRFTLLTYNLLADLYATVRRS